MVVQIATSKTWDLKLFSEWLYMQIPLLVCVRPVHTRLESFGQLYPMGCTCALGNLLALPLKVIMGGMDSGASEFLLHAYGNRTEPLQ